MYAADIANCLLRGEATWELSPAYEGTVVEGVLDLRGRTVPGAFLVENVCFKGELLLDYCTFLSPCNFLNTRFEKGISCKCAKLHKRFTITDSEVGILPGNSISNRENSASELILSDNCFAPPPSKDPALCFSDAKFIESLCVQRTTIRGSLLIDGVEVKHGLVASDLNVQGEVFAPNFCVQHNLDMTRTEVSGSVCLWNSRVKGDSLLDAIAIHRGLILQGARIDGNVLVRASKFEREKGALNCQRKPSIGCIAQTKCSVYMPNLYVGGSLNFLGISLAGYVQSDKIKIEKSFSISTSVIGEGNCIKSEINSTSSNGSSIAAHGSSIGGDCDFREITTLGCIDLRDSHIHARLRLGDYDQEESSDRPASNTKDKEKIKVGANKKGESIRLRGVTIGGELEAQGLCTKGGVECCNSKIDGNVRFKGAILGKNGDRCSLRLEGSHIGGALKAPYLKTEGALNLNKIAIGKGLNLEEAIIFKEAGRSENQQPCGNPKASNKNIGMQSHCAVSGRFAEIGRSVDLSKLKAYGYVDFSNILVKGHLVMDNAEIEGLYGLLQLALYGVGRAYKLKGHQSLPSNYYLDLLNKIGDNGQYEVSDVTKSVLRNECAFNNGDFVNLRELICSGEIFEPEFSSTISKLSNLPALHSLESFSLEGSKIGGRLCLNKLKVTGAVNLQSAVIEQSLYLFDAELGDLKSHKMLNDFGIYSLYAERTQISGKVILNGIKTSTGISFQDAKIGKKFRLVDYRSKRLEVDEDKTNRKSELGTATHIFREEKNHHRSKVNLSLNCHGIHVGSSFKIATTITGGIRLSSCNIECDTEIVLFEQDKKLFSESYGEKGRSAN